MSHQKLGVRPEGVVVKSIPPKSLLGSVQSPREALPCTPPPALNCRSPHRGLQIHQICPRLLGLILCSRRCFFTCEDCPMSRLCAKIFRSVRGFPKSLLLFVAAAALVSATACSDNGPNGPTLADIKAGKDIFRFNTFGDEKFWTDTLHMNTVIQSAVDPTTALSVGLKVDADTLPPAVLQAIEAGQVDLHSPTTTVTLLKLGAVVGVRATVDANNNITRLGITCALCHSTVDDRITAGIGSRLDGWPNRQLNPGAIIALSPALTAAQKAI